MHYDDYANRAATLAAALVNAVEEAPLDAPRLRSLLAAHDLPLAVAEEDADRAERFAEDLRAVFAAPDIDGAVAALNARLADTTVAPRLSVHDGRPPHLHYEVEGAGVDERLRANVLLGLAAVLCDGGRLRLGVCAARGCDRVYVDASRNARRRFCSSGCANRTHVADHRRRVRARSAPRGA